jgi:hypothetical protein
MFRKLSLSLAALAGILFFAGCTVNKDATFTLKQSWTVDQPSGTTYTGTQLLDPRSKSSDFDKYVSDVTNVQILSATYNVLNNTSPPGRLITTGSVSIGNDAGGPQSVLATVTGVDLSITGTEVPLVLDPATVTTLCNLLKNSPNKATAYLNVTSNGAPSTFTFQLTLNVKADISVGLLDILF